MRRGVFGGEPLQQAEALLPLLKDLRAVGKSIFIYSGATGENPARTQLACVEQADIVVLGRYVQELRNTNLRWRGSSNQVVEFLTDRYSEADMNGEAEYEYIHADGSTMVLGTLQATQRHSILQSRRTQIVVLEEVNYQ